MLGKSTLKKAQSPKWHQQIKMFKKQKNVLINKISNTMNSRTVHQDKNQLRVGLRGYIRNVEMVSKPTTF